MGVRHISSSGPTFLWNFWAMKNFLPPRVTCVCPGDNHYWKEFNEREVKVHFLQERRLSSIINDQQEQTPLLAIQEMLLTISPWLSLLTPRLVPSRQLLIPFRIGIWEGINASKAFWVGGRKVIFFSPSLDAPRTHQILPISHSVDKRSQWVRVLLIP